MCTVHAVRHLPLLVVKKYAGSPLPLHVVPDLCPCNADHDWYNALVNIENWWDQYVFVLNSCWSLDYFMQQHHLSQSSCALILGSFGLRWWAGFPSWRVKQFRTAGHGVSRKDHSLLAGCSAVCDAAFAVPACSTVPVGAVEATCSHRSPAWLDVLCRPCRVRWYRGIPVLQEQLR